MSTQPPPGSSGPPFDDAMPDDALPHDPFVRDLLAQLDAAAEGRDIPDGVAAAVVAQLADESSWTPPPAGLRDDVLARVLGPATPVSPLRPVPTPVPAPEPVVGERRRDTDTVVRPMVPRWRRLTWAVPAVAAAAVLITGGVLAVDHVLRDPRPGTSYVALGSPRAPGASAKVTVAEAAGGFSVVLDLHDLPAAPTGTYYSAWLNNGRVSVPLGSFHARGDGGPIKLWSGVDPRTFTRFTVTLQRDDQPPFPPGQRYLTGTVSR